MNKTNYKSHTNEISIIEIINFILRYKVFIIISTLIFIIIGSIISTTKYNIYRSEIPIKFKYNISNSKFNLTQTTELTRNLLLQDTSIKIFKKKFSELENIKETDIFSNNPIDIVYRDSTLKIIIDSPLALTELSIKNVLQSINHVIDYRNNNILEVFNFDQEKPPKYDMLNEIIAKKLLNYETLMNYEINTLEKTYKIQGNYKVSEAELSAYYSLSRKILLINSLRYTNLLGKILAQKKINTDDYEKYLTNYTKIKNSYEKYISIQENFYANDIIPNLINIDNSFLIMNTILSKKLIAYMFSFAIIGFFTSIIFCFIYTFFKKNKHKINIK